MFNLNWLSYSGSAVMDCSIAKNGTYIAHSRHPNLSGVASSNHNTTTLSISYYLDANDEIDVEGGMRLAGTVPMAYMVIATIGLLLTVLVG